MDFSFKIYKKKKKISPLYPFVKPNNLNVYPWENS